MMNHLLTHIADHPGRASLTGLTVFGFSLTALELPMKITLLGISILLGLISLYRNLKGKKGNDNGTD